MPLPLRGLGLSLKGVILKIAKKCVWVFIALLPMLVVFSYVVGNVGNTQGLVAIPLGEVSITETAEGARILSVTPDSWGDYILTPLFGSAPVGGFFGAVAGLVSYLDVNAGIPASVPVLSAILMLCYLAVVELCEMVVDFLLFVPRKCMELFR